MGVVAFIADIHGNLEALRATFRFLETQQVEVIHCLGDIVGYGPDPNSCIALVKEACTKVVAGNHDWAACGKTSISDFNPIAQEAIRWTREVLNDEEREYLADLPLTSQVNDALLVHSSPVAPELWIYITDPYEARVALESCTATHVMVGHTHIPMAFRLCGEKAEYLPCKGELELQQGARYLINVGSVGQPRDGDPRACCVIIKGDKLIFKRIPYAVEITSRKIIEKGLPPFLAHRIMRGW